MNDRRAHQPSTPEAAVRAARWAAAGLTAPLRVLSATSELIPPRSQGLFLVLPAGLIGLVSIAMGYRSYEWIRSRLDADASGPTRSRAFFVATVTALGVTEAAGLFGVIVYILSGRVVALSGVLTHVILAGAIWPTRERHDAFVES